MPGLELVPIAVGIFIAAMGAIVAAAAIGIFREVRSMHTEVTSMIDKHDRILFGEEDVEWDGIVGQVETHENRIETVETRHKNIASRLRDVEDDPNPDTDNYANAPHNHD